MPKKQTVIHYRKYEAKEGESDFESTLRKGIESNISEGHSLISRFKLRIQNIDGESVFANLLSSAQDSENKSYIFGDLVCFTKGQLQPLVDASKDDAASADVEQMTAPGEKEYLHSQMFWFVRKNHVLAIQSQSLQTKQLEDYFYWLLTTRTSINDKDHSVILASKFDSSAVGGDLADLKEVIIGGTVQTQDVQKKDQDEIVTEENLTKTIDKEAKGKSKTYIRKILDAVIPDSANVERILSSIPEKAELLVRVHIGFQTKKRKVDKQALKDIEVGLRNIPDSQLAVRGRDGVQDAEGNIRLQYRAGIDLTPGPDTAHPGALLSPSDVLRAMLEAYRYFEANGKIKA